MNRKSKLMALGVAMALMGPAMTANAQTTTKTVTPPCNVVPEPPAVNLMVPAVLVVGLVLRRRLRTRGISSNLAM